MYWQSESPEGCSNAGSSIWKKPTWLHFTALIIKSYMHWEVQNILIPLCHILKRIFYILLWFESQREKNHYITGILFTSPTFLSFYKTFLGMVLSLGNDLFTTNYYSYTCRSMNEDHLFSSLAFYFVKPFQYMEKWRPWCFQGFAKRVDLNEFKLIDADCCMLSQINSYLATTYFMEKPNSLITQYTRIERLILWILISHTNTLKWYQQ